MDFNNLDINALTTAGVGLAGTFLGGLATFAGAYVHDYRRVTRDRKSLAGALLAEQKAVLHVERTHKYRDIYQETLDRIRRGEAEPMPNIGYETNPARSVAYTNLSRIGTLPKPVPEKLVKLLYTFEVVAADRQCMDAGKWDVQDSARRAEMLESHLKTYDDLVAMAEDLIGALEAAT